MKKSGFVWQNLQTQNLIPPDISSWTVIKCIFSLRIKHAHFFIVIDPPEHAQHDCWPTLQRECMARFTRLCLNRYLRFWNQFLICSSFISRALANNARSSRVKYCWREKISSKYSSWNREKRLLLRFCFVISSPVVLLPWGSTNALLLVLFSDEKKVQIRRLNITEKHTSALLPTREMCLLGVKSLITYGVLHQIPLLKWHLSSLVVDLRVKISSRRIQRDIKIISN